MLLFVLAGVLIFLAAATLYFSRAKKANKKPAKTDKKPAKTDKKPEKKKPAKTDKKLAKVDTKPAKVDTKPAKMDTKPAKVDTKPAKVDTKPAKVDTKRKKKTLKFKDTPKVEQTPIVNKETPMRCTRRNTTRDIRTSKSDIKDEALEAHNYYRRIHGVPELEWDSKLEEEAQKVGDMCKWEHSTLPYGENLGLGHPNMASLSDQWYDEIGSYNYDVPSFSLATGHFTQMVWADTRKIGCAIGNCPNGVTDKGKLWDWGNVSKDLKNHRLWVCQYWPPGNYRGQFSKSVKPPSKTCEPV